MVAPSVGWSWSIKSRQVRKSTISSVGVIFKSQEDSSQCWFRIKEFQHHLRSKTNMKFNWLLKNHNAIIWGTEKVWNPNDWFGDNQTARQLARQGIRRKGLCFEIKFIKSHFLYFSPKYLHNPMINFVQKGTIASVWLGDSSGKIQ